jgi:CheY-like chemotaxis protein
MGQPGAAVSPRVAERLWRASEMRTVLIVDDSPVDRRLASRLLEGTGDWKVLQAEDGQQALAVLQAQAVDAIVTDLYMPVMDGLALLSAVKLAQLETPVLLMTSRGSEEIATKALSSGAASYVPKRRLAEVLADTLARVSDSAEAGNTQFCELFRGMRHCTAEYCLENDSDTFRPPLHLVRNLVQAVAGLLPAGTADLHGAPCLSRMTSP